MAVPRLALGGGGRDDAVALPHPLDAGVAARLRRIFALQRGGDMPAAIAETSRLGDATLLGDILAERYLAADLPGPARPSAAQLRGWLRDFSDLPDAPAIYRLLASTSPHGIRLPLPPDSLTLGRESPAAPLPEEADPADRAFTRNPLLDRTVQERLAPGGAGACSALHLVAATRHLDPLYAAQLRAEIALRLFTDGNTGQALATGRAAFTGSHGRIGLAGYVAGLAAWRSGRPRRGFAPVRGGVASRPHPGQHSCGRRLLGGARARPGRRRRRLPALARARRRGTAHLLWAAGEPAAAAATGLGPALGTTASFGQPDRRARRLRRRGRQ